MAVLDSKGNIITPAEKSLQYTKLKTLDTSDINVLAIAAIKELDAQVQALEARVKALEVK